MQKSGKDSFYQEKFSHYDYCCLANQFGSKFIRPVLFWSNFSIFIFYRMTSLCQINTKIAKIIAYRYILLRSKYELNWSLLNNFRAKNVFSLLNMRKRGISGTILPKWHNRGIQVIKIFFDYISSDKFRRIQSFWWPSSNFLKISAKSLSVGGERGAKSPPSCGVDRVKLS